MTPETGSSRGRSTVVLPAAGIVVLVVLAYLPALQAGFVWDDDRWLTGNPAVVGDGPWLDLWTGVERLQYYPLLYTAFRIEHRLWGLDPLGYHVVNILLHAANALLCAFLLRRLRIPGAWWVAAVFAVHPVHVESVAWVTELKNVLSGLFVFGSALVFSWHDERPGRRTWALSLALFAAALSTKTAVAPLPVVFAVILIWLHGRLTKRDLARLWPFFVTAALYAFVTVRLERGMVDAVGFDFDLSFGQRMAQAARALLFYPQKLLLPWPTIFNYPRWNLEGSAARVYAPVLVVIALAVVGIVLWRRGHRGVVLAAVAYAALISPALGFIDVYYFRYSFVADHFQYLASVPALVVLIEAARRLAAKAPAAGRAVGSIALLVLGVLTWNQASAYRDLPTLLRDVLAKNPGSWFAQHNLGDWLLNHGEPAEALVHYDEALRSKPSSAETYVSRGMARSRIGDLEGALEDFDRAVDLDPLYPYARLQRATARVEAGMYEPALEDLRPFVRPDSAYLPALRLRSRALGALQRWPEALRDLDRVIAVSPSAAAYVERAYVLNQLDRTDRAMADADRALRLDPDSSIAWSLRGTLWRRRGDRDRACADWSQACTLGDCESYDRLCR